MSGVIMDGKVIAREIKTKIRREVSRLNIEPTLATVMVGNDPASKAYLDQKQTACLDVGIHSKNIELPASTEQAELERALRRLNDDSSVTGILLQLPLPKGINKLSALDTISPTKDVDGLAPSNFGLLLHGDGKLIPCTPRSVVVLLKIYLGQLSGHHSVIVNRSNVIGRPLSQLLLNLDSTVTVCHSKTRDLPSICRQADILITGIGRRPGFVVTTNFVKPGATVIDAGTSIIDGRVTGDVDFLQVAQVAGHITPVPGGVGPVTTAMLLYNTLLAVCLEKHLDIGFTPEELYRSEHT